MSFPRKRESRTNVLGPRLRGGDGYLVGSAQNRESRGRRPRLSAKEEKKRFRPSGGQHTPRVGGLAWRAPDARPTESLRRAGSARPATLRWYCGPSIEGLPEPRSFREAGDRC